MLGQSSSPILAKAEQALIAKVPQQLQGDLTKVVQAGMQILYAPQLQGQLKQKLATTDPVQSAAQGAVNLIAELYKQSKFTIPKPLIVPALLLFAFEYMDLAAKAGKAQITDDLVAQVTKLATDKFLALTKAQVPGQPGAADGAPAAPPPSGGIIAGQMQGAQ